MTEETYIAIILYERLSSSSAAKSLYEENYLLITALSQEEAEQKAELYGQQNQPHYKNVNGDEIHWSFIKVESVHLTLESISPDVTPIHSRYFEDMPTYERYRRIEE